MKACKAKCKVVGFFFPKFITGCFCADSLKSLDVQDNSLQLLEKYCWVPLRCSGL